MAIATLLRANITSVEKTPHAAITWFLESVNARDDRLQWIATIINFLDIATSAVRKIGVMIEMDLGDGALSVIPAKDLGDTVTISDSLDGYGLQTADFARFGDDQAPIKSSMLRRMGAVKITGYRGTNGSIGSRTLFEGFIRQGSYDAYPPMGRIQCLDSALEFVDKPFIYTLAQGSHIAREVALLDMCSLHGVPVGTWDLPIVDGLRGGKLFKGIEEGGEQTFMSFLVEWLIPIRCRPQMRDGKLNIRPFDTSDDPIRTLGPGDIRSLSCEPPQTNGHNAVAMSSSIFNYTGPEGRRTLPPDVVETFGIRTSVVAINRQNKADGSITPLSIPVASGTMLTGRTITTRTFDGGTIVEETISEYGWYAIRAARLKQTAVTGVVSWNPDFDVYQYADGSWRTTQTEEFQLIRQTQRVRNFDVDTGYLVSVDETLYEYSPAIAPNGTLNMTTGAEIPAAVHLTEDHVAWQTGVEIFYPEHNLTHYGQTGDGQLSFTRKDVDASIRTTYTASTNFAPPFAGPQRYYFRRTGYTWYGTDVGLNIRLADETTSYTPIDESSHRESVTRRVIGGAGLYYPPTRQFVAGSFERVVPGGIPFVDQLTAYQVAQSATVTVYDDVKIAMARGVEEIDGRQNDYCETDGELRTAAFEALRDNDHLVVNIEMDFDMICEAGKVVALAAHPQFNYQTVNVLIVQREITLNCATGENSQTLTCRFYPPELIEPLQQFHVAA